MMHASPEQVQASPPAEVETGSHLIDLLLPLALHWKLLLGGTVVTAAAALGLTYLMPKVYTSRVVILPPQQAQSAVAGALSQLGALSGLLGGAGGVGGAYKSPAEQYVALLQSQNVADRVIDAFDLQKVYDKQFRFQTRDELSRNATVTFGKKDGLIAVEVDDEDPKRAADIANRYITELRRVTSELALTEAQQRRVFFESQLQLTRDRLTKAQQALQGSGFSQGVLRADARASADAYARLRAEITSGEVRLQTLRRSLADGAPEVQQAMSALSALRAQLAKLEDATEVNGAPDYIGRYREFKYQETLFDLFARQYELARLDESREGALIQVVDEAKPAEYKSRPKRALIAAGAGLATLVVLMAWVQARFAWRQAAQRPQTAAKLAELRTAWRGRTS